LKDSTVPVWDQSQAKTAVQSHGIWCIYVELLVAVAHTPVEHMELHLKQLQSLYEVWQTASWIL